MQATSDAFNFMSGSQIQTSLVSALLGTQNGGMMHLLTRVVNQNWLSSGTQRRLAIRVLGSLKHGTRLRQVTRPIVV